MTKSELSQLIYYLKELLTDPGDLSHAPERIRSSLIRLSESSVALSEAQSAKIVADEDLAQAREQLRRAELVAAAADRACSLLEEDVRATEALIHARFSGAVDANNSKE